MCHKCHKNEENVTNKQFSCNFQIQRKFTFIVELIKEIYSSYFKKSEMGLKEERGRERERDRQMDRRAGRERDRFIEL